MRCHAMRDDTIHKGRPKADIVREVAWILHCRSALKMLKRGEMSKILKLLRTYSMDGPGVDLITEEASHPNRVGPHSWLGLRLNLAQCKLVMGEGGERWSVFALVHTVGLLSFKGLLQ